MKADITELAGYFSTMNINLINVVRSVVPPGGRQFGVFTPPYSGFIFPLHGKARMFFDSIPYVMEAGKIFHSGPNMALDKEVLGESEWDFMVIHYQIDDNSKSTFSYASSHYQLDPGHSTRINDMLHRLYHISNTPGNLPMLRAKSIFFSLLDEIFTRVDQQQKDNSRDQIEQSIEYIKLHYMAPLTIPELAEQYGLTARQFAYLFQKYAGMGPNEYLIDQRMRHAKELLCATTFSVAEVAAYVGYSDPYYFSKLFKKRIGLSPSALQRSL